MSSPNVDFKSLSTIFPHKDPERQSPWYVYAGVIIEAVASPKYIAELWKYLASAFSEQDQLVVARRLREGLLKTSVLAGFPRGINALAALRTAVNESSPDIGKTLELDKSLRHDVSAKDMEARGEKFFKDVYERHAERVLDNMGKTSGGDLNNFAVFSVYGELMAETRIFNEKETGLMEFLVCYATEAVPQAKGHMYGSRNLGNSKAEIQGGIQLVQSLMKAMKIPLDEGEMTFTEKMDSW